VDNLGHPKAPLYPLDTDNETYGCRHSNPDICGKHSLKGVCAFVNEDKICYSPPRSWRKQYFLLISDKSIKGKNDETQ
jgi:hypothetical protein